MNILIVDDCQDIREILNFQLTADGHKVIEAENGLDALSKLKCQEIDFIITDHRMPRAGDGLKFARLAKNITDAPILLHTSDEGEISMTPELIGIVGKLKIDKINNFLLKTRVS